MISTSGIIPVFHVLTAGGAELSHTMEGGIFIVNNYYQMVGEEDKEGKEDKEDCLFSGQINEDPCYRHR